jgi:hypothetical protein
MQRSLIGKLFLTWFCISFLFNSSAATEISGKANNNDSNEKGQHFIILIDAKLEDTRAEFRNNNGSNFTPFKKTSDGTYLKILKLALESNPYTLPGNDHHLRYKTFKAGRDIFSLIIHRFPSFDHSSENGNTNQEAIQSQEYFHTSSEVLQLKNLEDSIETVKTFFDDKYKSFEKKKEKYQPTSARDFAEKMVIAYFSQEFKKLFQKEGSLTKTKIDNIIIISINDGDNWNPNIKEDKNFVDNILPQWEEFNKHFKHENIINKATKAPHFVINKDKRELILSPTHGARKKIIYIDYILVKPNLEVNRKLISQVKLERVAKKPKEDSKKLERVAKKTGEASQFGWKGERGIEFTPIKPPTDDQKYSTQWAQVSKSGYKWHEFEETDLSNLKPGKRHYRFVVKNYQVPDKDLFYPFDYSPAIAWEEVEYILKEEGDDGYPKKYVFEWPWSIEQEGVITDTVLKNLFLKSGKDMLTASEASNITLETARRERFWFLTRIGALLFLLFLLIIIIKCTRYPKIRPIIHGEINEFGIDFSGKNRDIVSLASLEFRNVRPGVCKSKLKGLFDAKLELKGTFKYKHKEGQSNTINLDDVIAPKKDMLLYMTKVESEENPLPLKWETDVLSATLEGTGLRERFKIYFNPAAVEDLITANNQDTVMTFSLELNVLEATYLKKPKLNPLDFKNCTVNKEFTVKFSPEKREPDIRVEQVKQEWKNNFRFNPDEKCYTIPYTVKEDSLSQDLFRITIANNNEHQFSTPVKDTLTLLVRENNALLEAGKVFHLKKIQQPDRQKNPSQEPDILKKGEKSVYAVSIFFPDMEKNPINSRQFMLRLKYNDKIISEGEKDITVNASEETTSPLLSIIINENKMSPQNVYQDCMNSNGELVVNEVGEESFCLEYEHPTDEPLAITDEDSKQLFELKLKNSCTTGTGYYELSIDEDNIEFHPQPSISDEKIGIKKKEGSTKQVTLEGAGAKGKVEDNKDSHSDSHFMLESDEIEITRKELSFDIRFQLTLDYFAKGASFDKTKTITIDITVKITGEHLVNPHFIVIDFGTTAIAVESLNSLKKEDCESVLLESPNSAHLRSRDGLLPSVINYNPNGNNGNGKSDEQNCFPSASKDFIQLPAITSIISAKPELLISGLKLLLLEDRRSLPFPPGFAYLREDGVTCKGKKNDSGRCSADKKERDRCDRLNKNDKSTCTDDGIDLKELISSTYSNFKLNHLDNSDKLYYENIAGYKQLIFTHPNLYNQLHINILKNVISTVFTGNGKYTYKENIRPVSESDAALYNYLYNTAYDVRPNSHKILVVDIGGGTMDISYAEIKWPESQNHTNRPPIPLSIEILSKDGITLAGETLDKAIALQVHNILVEYQKDNGDDSAKTSGAANKINNNATHKTESATPVQNPKEVNEDFLNSIANKQGQNNTEPESIPGSNMPSPQQFPEKVKNILSYNDKYNIVSRGAKLSDEETGDIISLMWNFKQEHITNFKKAMSNAKDDDETIKLCLGQNSNDDICFLAGTSVNSSYFDDENNVFDWAVERGPGNSIRLCLKKKDWLNMPYLRRFRELFRDKLQDFFKNNNYSIPENLEVALSGRTALWPSIKNVLEELNMNPSFVDCNSDYSHEKGINMKRAVARGAYRKEVLWDNVDYKTCDWAGQPAIRYKTRDAKTHKLKPEVQILEVGVPKKISLEESDTFTLGIKTSMDFITFSSSTRQTRQFCKGTKEIVILAEAKNAENMSLESLPWNFKINGELLKVKRKKENVPFLKLCKTVWPTMSPQLPDIKPEEFNEKT